MTGIFMMGYITVWEYIRCDHTLHISEFDPYLKELAKMYYEGMPTATPMTKTERSGKTIHNVHE